ncbi:MAG TPA: DNA-processing protein DprA [Dissulfurispiraceae bacterium]|nr:DNA-processing protein DprA [Dissulfurispiraceae bacterium]
MRSLVQVDSLYPAALGTIPGDATPQVISLIGNSDILQNKKLAVISSVKCPGHIILKTYDLMKQLRDAGVTVISGFHSPMEQECLNILLKGSQPIIVCPARSLEGMRIKAEFRKPLEDGRLLILSPFTAKYNRISAARAECRNRFVVALADEILVPYAAPGSKTELLCAEAARWSRPVVRLDLGNAALSFAY